MSELQVPHNARENYLSHIMSAYHRWDIKEPSIWLGRDPEAEEKMLRVPPILQPTEFRQMQVAGREWKLVPKTERDPRAQLAVAVGTEICQLIPRFGEARKTLARTFIHGTRYSKIHFEPCELKIGDGRPRVWFKVCHLEDRSKNRYRKIIENPTGPVEQVHAKWQQWDMFGPNPGWRDLTPQEWKCVIKHRYNDEEGGLGYGKGLREALAWVWYTLMHVNQESIGAIERFARGLPIMKIDGLRQGKKGLPNTTLANNAVNTMKKAMARHIVAIDSRDQLEVQSGSMEGWQMLKDFRQELKDDARTLILHAVLPTGGGAPVGSYSRAQVEEGSTDAVIAFDRQSLEETLERDLLGAIWWRNHRNMVELGIADEMPRFDLSQSRAEDPNDVAQNAATMLQAGVSLAKQEVYDRTGWRVPEPDEDVVAPRPAPSPFPAAGLPGGGAPGLGFRRGEPSREEFGAGVFE